MTRSILILMIVASIAHGQTKRHSPCSEPLGVVKNFAVVFFDDDSLDELSKFDMVVLDPANYDSSDILKLKSLGCRPYAYFNVGEVETYRDYFDLVDTSLILGADPNWRDRYYIDICDPQWFEILSRARIPDIMAKGFCGLFIDFADLFNEFPETEDCAVTLVRKIRKELPKSDLVVDGANAILDRIGNDIDGVVVEGLRGGYDFDSDQYYERADSSVQRESDRLLLFAKKYKTGVFQLDYAAPQNEKLRDDIIFQSRKWGFIPYVGTVELDTLFTDSIRKLKNSTSKTAVPPADSLKQY